MNEESGFLSAAITQEFIPANGKTKLNRANTALNDFVEDIFNIDGTFKTTDFQAQPSKSNCMYCPFKNKKELCDKAFS